MAAFTRPADADGAGAFDKWFEKQLERFWGEGFGKGVLVLNLPDELNWSVKSKPRPIEAAANDVLLKFSRLEASAFTDCIYYTIHRTEASHKISTSDIRSKISVASSNADYETLQHTLREKKAARYSDGVDATTNLRRSLGIGDSPFTTWRCGSLAQTTEPARGIHTPYLYVAAGAPNGTSAAAAVAPFALHVEDSFLYSLNYLHAGAPKYWVVVHPHDGERLEWRLRETHHRRPTGANGARSSSTRSSRTSGPSGAGGAGDAAAATDSLPCSQFVRHMSAWVPVDVLDRWDIRYTRVEQRAGELVVTAPGAYHQGWNGGWNVAEAINYGDARSAARTRGYRYCRTGQCPVAPLKLSWRDADGGDDDSDGDEADEAAVPREWAVSSSRPDGRVLGPDADIVAVQGRLRADKLLTAAETGFAVSAVGRMLDEISHKAPRGSAVRKQLKDIATALNKPAGKQIVADASRAVVLTPKKRQFSVAAPGTQCSPVESCGAAAAAKRKRTNSSHGSASASTGVRSSASCAAQGQTTTSTARRSSRANPKSTERRQDAGAGASEEDELDETGDGETPSATPAVEHSGAATTCSPTISAQHTDTNGIAHPPESLGEGPPATATPATIAYTVPDVAVTTAPPAAPTSPAAAAPAAAAAAEANVLQNADKAYTLICIDAHFDLEGWHAAAAAAATNRPGDGETNNKTSNNNNGTDGSGTGGGMGSGNFLSGDVPHAELVMRGDWAGSVRDARGELCSAQAMLGRLQRAQTHSARARFHRNMALVQLAAWVAAHMAADDHGVDKSNSNSNNDNNAQRQALPSPPSTAIPATTTATVATTATATMETRTMTKKARQQAAATALTTTTTMREKARLTTVLDALVALDPQRRSRDVWRRECAAGRHWTALVARFGAGVALVKPRLMGMTTKGLGNVSHDEFERVLAALAADAVFAQIMTHVTTRLRACHMPVDAAEHARAAEYLRVASVGLRPWATTTTTPAPTPPLPATVAPAPAPVPALVTDPGPAPAAASVAAHEPAPAGASVAAPALAAVCVPDADPDADQEPQRVLGGSDAISALASVAAAAPALALAPAQPSPGAAAAIAVAGDANAAPAPACGGMICYPQPVAYGA